MVSSFITKLKIENYKSIKNLSIRTKPWKKKTLNIPNSIEDRLCYGSSQLSW